MRGEPGPGGGHRRRLRKRPSAARCRRPAHAAAGPRAPGPHSRCRCGRPWVTPSRPAESDALTPTWSRAGFGPVHPSREEEGFWRFAIARSLTELSTRIRLGELAIRSESDSAVTPMNIRAISSFSAVLLSFQSCTGMKLVSSPFLNSAPFVGSKTCHRGMISTALRPSLLGSANIASMGSSSGSTLRYQTAKLPCGWSRITCKMITSNNVDFDKSKFPRPLKGVLFDMDVSSVDILLEIILSNSTQIILSNNFTFCLGSVPSTSLC